MGAGQDAAEAKATPADDEQSDPNAYADALDKRPATKGGTERQVAPARSSPAIFP